MKAVGLEKVRGTEGLYRYPPNGKYYARLVVNGKELPLARKAEYNPVAEDTRSKGRTAE
jgi:hypothetical protein